jgi:hypothetical protein
VGARARHDDARTPVVAVVVANGSINRVAGSLQWNHLHVLAPDFNHARIALRGGAADGRKYRCIPVVAAILTLAILAEFG